MGAFTQFTHLPKMLRNKAILDTLIAGCQQGMFALRLTRPDRSVQTFWRAAGRDDRKGPGAGGRVARSGREELQSRSPFAFWSGGGNMWRR